MDVVGLAYPGCFYSKLDWKDAFFSVPLYPPFRRFFCFEHPGDQTVSNFSPNGE